MSDFRSGCGPGDAGFGGEAHPPEVPGALLAPLLEVAGEVLRGLPPAEAPPAARHLAAFDRRGLATPVARAQLRRVLEADDGFFALVAERFRDRSEAAAVLSEWRPGEALSQVARAKDEGRLPQLVSGLYAARPEGWRFALGVAVGAFEAEGAAAGIEGRVRLLTSRLASLEEAKRRGEAAKATAEGQLAHLEAELREERRARRAREEHAAGEAAAAQRRVRELEAALAEVERRLTQAEARARRESERAGRAEAAEHAARAALAAVEAATDRATLEEAARAAARLAATLEALVPGEDAGGGPSGAGGGMGAGSARRDRAEGASAETTSPGGRERRAPVRVPPGMRAETAEAAEAMVHTPGLAVVVDGYNVSMLAWPDIRPAEQRERLCDALAEFHLRARCPVTVVFDGAEVTTGRLSRRPGVHVVFSAPEQEADEVVVAEVAARPRSVPVLAVSSDTWVRAHAEAEGAAVLPSGLFLGLLRR